MHETIQILQRLGLKPIQLQAWLADEPPADAPPRSLLPWRVRAMDRGRCHLVSVKDEETETDGEQHPLWGAPFDTLSVDTPTSTAVAVGDWLMLTASSDGNLAVTDVLPRTSCIKRGTASGQAGEQLIVSNVDTALLVAAFATTEKLLRRGINPRRLERYVAACRQGDTEPVIVLNKADLSERVHEVVAELERYFGGVPVVAVSAQQDHQLAALQEYLPAGSSVALLGSSGVGKSTLVNRLLGSEHLDTGDVRGADTKGKHTTTRRELVLLDNGCLLIDTPGMRELAVVGDDPSELGFEDIEALATECRFADCRHEAEPGCEVQRAVGDGRLPVERLQSYLALSREVLRHQARHDAYARHLQNKEYRRFNKVVKEAMKLRRR